MKGNAMIRPAAQVDAPELASLHREERLHATPTWVAEDDTGLVGFVCAGPGRDEGVGLELMALYVRARCYDTGTGSGLLREAIGDRAAYLGVLEGNTRAIRFYARQGFAFDGHVKETDEGPERRMARG